MGWGQRRDSPVGRGGGESRMLHSRFGGRPGAWGCSRSVFVLTITCWEDVGWSVSASSEEAAPGGSGRQRCTGGEMWRLITGSQGESGEEIISHSQ